MIPCPSYTASLILCQYFFMFLPHDQEQHLCFEINRIARIGCLLVLEVQDIKSGVRNYEHIQELRAEINLKRDRSCQWAAMRETAKRGIYQLKRS
jgi:hypothetical protein